MTNEELIQYGINWDKALESRGDEPMSEARQFLASAIQAIEAQRWIFVKERHPEKDGEYLLWSEEFGAFVGNYDSCDEKFGYWNNIYDDETFGYVDSEFIEYQDILAWRELPSPYREGEQDAKNNTDND